MSCVASYESHIPDFWLGIGVAPTLGSLPHPQHCAMARQIDRKFVKCRASEWLLKSKDEEHDLCSASRNFVDHQWSMSLSVDKVIECAAIHRSEFVVALVLISRLDVFAHVGAIEPVTKSSVVVPRPYPRDDTDLSAAVLISRYPLGFFHQ